LKILNLLRKSRARLRSIYRIRWKGFNQRITSKNRRNSAKKPLNKEEKY